MYRSLAFRVFMVVLHNTYSASAAIFDDEVIIKPGQDIYEMPASCLAKNQSYCFEMGDNYPQKKIDDLVQRFQVNMLMSPTFKSRGIMNGVEDRGTNNSFEEQDCPFESSSEPIYYIIDKNHKTRVVVQSPHFMQHYTLKWCQKEGRITENTKHFIKGTQTLENFYVECVTTRLDFEFYVLNDEYFEPAIEIVRTRDSVPVCCKCRVSSISENGTN